RDQLPDIMDRQSIKLAQPVGNAHGRDELVWRVTLEDREPAKTFAQDARQTIENVNGKSFDLHVKAVRRPPDVEPPGTPQPGKEFTESNFFITIDDPKVKQFAAEAVGQEVDPWRKAVAVEAWVHTHMKVQNFTEELAPAAEVARTLTG